VYCNFITFHIISPKFNKLLNYCWTICCTKDHTVTFFTSRWTSLFCNYHLFGFWH